LIAAWFAIAINFDYNRKGNHETKRICALAGQARRDLKMSLVEGVKKRLKLK
jgi:hypothetical protein